MNTMMVRDDLEVLSHKHLYADSLKEKLMTEAFGVESSGYENTKFTNIVGTKLMVDTSPDAPSKIIRDWVVNTIRNKYFYANVQRMGYNSTLWFAKYNKGDYAKNHSHEPYALFSWVYFINCSKGSSPLVFTTSGKKIKAEEGKCIIFPSHLRHHVPKNRCENRLTLVGNVMPYPMD